MTENQFTVYINWRNKEKRITNEVVLKDGGQPIAEIISYEDAWLLRDILNELHEENKALKKENKELEKQLWENNCDNCKYSKAIYADVECRKKGLTKWKFDCDEFKRDRND